MTAFGASSLDHEIVYDSASTDPNVIAAVRSSIMMRVIEAFAAENIEFAYPTQTTFTAAPDGTLVMPYATHPVVVTTGDCPPGDRNANRNC
jgi:small-conductance mechanosensitive channel